MINVKTNALKKMGSQNTPQNNDGSNLAEYGALGVGLGATGYGVHQMYKVKKRENILNNIKNRAKNYEQRVNDFYKVTKDKSLTALKNVKHNKDNVIKNINKYYDLRDELEKIDQEIDKLRRLGKRDEINKLKSRMSLLRKEKEDIWPFVADFVSVEDKGREGLNRIPEYEEALDKIKKLKMSHFIDKENPSTPSAVFRDLKIMEKFKHKIPFSGYHEYNKAKTKALLSLGIGVPLMAYGLYKTFESDKQ